VSRIYIDNPFAIEVVAAKNEKSAGVSVLCVSISILRSMIAVVTSNRKLHVYDLSTQTCIHQANQVNTACFNSEVNLS
jgi:hypothetical protein